MSDAPMRWVSRFYREREPLRGRVRDLAGRGGALVLDAGCRKGEVTAPLAAGERRVVGVDRMFYDDWRASPTEVEFVCADVIALPFRDGTFDRVVSSECLQYVADWRRALDEFRRVLRPGGNLILTCPNGVLTNRILDPYVLHDRVRRLFARGRPRAVEHRPAWRIRAHLATGWDTIECGIHGTPLYIWAAAAMETLERIRLGWVNWRGLGHGVGGRALLAGIRALGNVMILDYSLRLGPLSYNTVLVLRKRAGPPR